VDALSVDEKQLKEVSHEERLIYDVTIK